MMIVQEVTMPPFILSQCQCSIIGIIDKVTETVLPKGIYIIEGTPMLFRSSSKSNYSIL
jgi:hypothetical protein